MDWIHCNICFSQPSKEKHFSLTSCGHMYCEDCLGNGTENGKCNVCQTKCSSVQLVPDMESDVKEFFAEPQEIVQKLLQVLDFQKKHRMKLTTHWVTLNRKYAEAKVEVKRLRSISEKLYTNYKELYKENKALKIALNSTPKNGVRSPFISPQNNIPQHSSKPNCPQSASNQVFKSNLVTPLRVTKQRYPTGSGLAKYSMPNTNVGSGNLDCSRPYLNTSAFLTPPADTPELKLNTMASHNGNRYSKNYYK